MRYIAVAICFSLIGKYLMVLTNLTFANTPMGFPKGFEYYPCAPDASQPGGIDCPDSVNTDSQKYYFPWYMRYDYLRDNATEAMFLGIDI